MSAIEAMQQQVKSGQAHPMKMKQGLATKIVADFHGEPAAQKAQEDWSKQFQKGEVPEDVETVSVRADAVSVKADAVSLDGESGGVFFRTGDRELQNVETVTVHAGTVADAPELQDGTPLVGGPVIIKTDRLLVAAGRSEERRVGKECRL